MKFSHHWSTSLTQMPCRSSKNSLIARLVGCYRRFSISASSLAQQRHSERPNHCSNISVPGPARSVLRQQYDRCFRCLSPGTVSFYPCWTSFDAPESGHRLLEMVCKFIHPIERTLSPTLFRLAGILDDGKAVTLAIKNFERFILQFDDLYMDLDQTKKDQHLLDAKEALEKLKETASEPDFVYKALALRFNE
ncbi:hypothetical protein C8J56DRAFT_209168 [Mycena floridula]|nr:hypothetical protein C8J56DRAFT_209168 [Mycena floridula]